MSIAQCTQDYLNPNGDSGYKKKAMYVHAILVCVFDNTSFPLVTTLMHLIMQMTYGLQHFTCHLANLRQQSKDILALLSGISQGAHGAHGSITHGSIYNFPRQCCNDKQWFSQNADPAPDEAMTKILPCMNTSIEVFGPQAGIEGHFWIVPYLNMHVLYRYMYYRCYYNFITIFGSIPECTASATATV